MHIEHKYIQYCIFLTSTLFMSLSWLWPKAYQPWLSYTQDLFTFFAVSTLFILLINKKININFMFLIFICMSAIPLIQYGLGILYYASDAILVSYYLLFFCLAYLVGYNFSYYFDKEKIFIFISILIGVCACISACFSILQYLGYSFDFLRYLKGDRPYANFGQPNNMATFHFMGILSLLYLNQVKRINHQIFILLSILLIFSLVISQSRAVWLSFILVFLLSMFASNRKPIIIKLSFLGLIYISISLVLNTILSSINTTALERGLGGGWRLEHWKHLIYAIQQKPWFGYGWYQTHIAQLEGVLLFKNEGYLSSAHNIILDILLWNGIPLGCLIVSLCFYILFKILKSKLKTNEFIMFLIIVPILGHSLLEYPLYYAFFLIPFALILGVLSDGIRPIFSLNEDASKLIFLVLIVVFAFSYQQIYITMNRLSVASFYSESNQQLNYPDKIILLNKMSIQEEWLLLDPLSQVDVNKINIFRNFVMHHPTYYNLMKFSQLLASNRQYDEARQKLRILNALYSKNHSEDELLKKIDFKGNLTISNAN